MERTVVSANGRMVIPVRLRNKLGMKPGTVVFFSEKDGDIIIHPIVKVERARHRQ